MKETQLNYLIYMQITENNKRFETYRQPIAIGDYYEKKNPKSDLGWWERDESGIKDIKADVRNRKAKTGGLDTGVSLPHGNALFWNEYDPLPEVFILKKFRRETYLRFIL